MRRTMIVFLAAAAAGMTHPASVIASDQVRAERCRMFQQDLIRMNSLCPDMFPASSIQPLLNTCVRQTIDEQSATGQLFRLQREACEARVASGGGGGGDGGGGGGGGGNARIVDVDTDTYDAREGARTGMLAANTQVTTIGTCGDDWCQLSNPPGWIWGGDLR